MKNLTKTLFKALILAAGVTPMVTSCYDDSSIWDEFEKIENRLDELENSLNSQLQALNALIDGKTTVTSCEKNADGSYKVTLSNGTIFSVLPSNTHMSDIVNNYSSLVSFITIDGVKYWATYDSNGNLVAVTDNAGQPVPVVPVSDGPEYRAQVEVLVENGKYYLVIDGNRYMTGYDTEDLIQVFSSCEQLKDASGNVYAMQIPDGWRVAEREDKYTEEIYIDITAPSASTIQAGAAVAEGELKLVAVVEGGKAAVSKLHVSSEAFKVFDVNGNKAVIEPFNGVQKYVYGITAKKDYNESTLVETVSQLLQSSSDFPAGYAVAEASINANHEDTFGGKLSNNVEYVFWAVPALYSDDDSVGYYVKEGNFRTHTFANVNVKFTKVSATLLDAEIEVSFDGVKKIYAGTAQKTADVFTEITRLIEYEAITPVDAPETYKGLASAFPSAAANEDVEFAPNTTYISWVVPVEEGKATYSENDIVSVEFKTKSITSGSSLEVSFGKVNASLEAISIPVSAAGAEMIFYAYMPKSEGDRLAGVDNDTLAEVVMEHNSCVSVKGNATTAAIERLAPSSTMWLYAVAVDKDGKYGKVNRVSATTGNLEYNELTVTATEVNVTSDAATIKVEVSGGTAVDFVYWFGRSNDNFWVNSKLLGGTKETAQQYLALYPQDENVKKVMSKYGKIGQDGTITLNNLDINSEYIFVVVAVDKNGHSSYCGYKMVKTLKANLGNIVKTGSDQWNQAKSQINIEWIKERFKKGSSNMFSSYGLNFSCPTEYTAYIICGSEEYYEDPSFFKSKEDMIIDIRAFASRKYDVSIVATDANGELLSEPDWIDDNGNIHGGTLMNPCTFYVHGVPSRGFLTYFGKDHYNNCPEMENGACSNYERAKTMIAERSSLDWWKEYFKNNKGVKNEAYQLQNAQAYLNAYAPYYKDAEPPLYINNGDKVVISTQEATGMDDSGKVVDDVVVVLMDSNGNFYEPMYFVVPNYFK